MARGRHWRPFLERFEDSYTPEPNSGCWLWIGSMTGTGHACGKGYGAISKDGRYVRAHRISWEMANGPIPDGMHVLHKCDTTTCVNPDHLFIGTNLDNVLDKVAKGRARSGRLCGSRNGASKLTDETVRLIRVSSESAPILAAKLGVSSTAIKRVRRRELWAHVI